MHKSFFVFTVLLTIISGFEAIEGMEAMEKIEKGRKSAKSSDSDEHRRIIPCYPALSYHWLTCTSGMTDVSISPGFNKLKNELDPNFYVLKNELGTEIEEWHQDRQKAYEACRSAKSALVMAEEEHKANPSENTQDILSVATQNFALIQDKFMKKYLPLSVLRSDREATQQEKNTVILRIYEKLIYQKSNVIQQPRSGIVSTKKAIGTSYFKCPHELIGIEHNSQGFMISDVRDLTITYHQLERLIDRLKREVDILEEVNIFYTSRFLEKVKDWNSWAFTNWLNLEAVIKADQEDLRKSIETQYPAVTLPGKYYRDRATSEGLILACLNKDKRGIKVFKPLNKKIIKVSDFEQGFSRENERNKETTLPLPDPLSLSELTELGVFEICSDTYMAKNFHRRLWVNVLPENNKEAKKLLRDARKSLKPLPESLKKPLPVPSVDDYEGLYQRYNELLIIKNQMIDDLTAPYSRFSWIPIGYEFFMFEHSVVSSPQPSQIVVLKKLGLNDEGLLKPVVHSLGYDRGYDLLPRSALPQNISPEKGKIYLEKHNNKLEYTVIAPDGKVVEEVLDVIIEEELTPEILKVFKSHILNETSKRGHTTYTYPLEQPYTEVDLSENNLTSGRNYHFSKTLAILNICCNQLKRMNFVCGLSGLRILNISHNQIKDLSPLTNCPVLEMLDVSYNCLTTLKPLNNAVLVSLTAHNNKLQESWEEAFPSSLTKLTHLDVTENPNLRFGDSSEQPSSIISIVDGFKKLYPTLKELKLTWGEENKTCPIGGRLVFRSQEIDSEHIVLQDMELRLKRTKGEEEKYDLSYWAELDLYDNQLQVTSLSLSSLYVTGLNIKSNRLSSLDFIKDLTALRDLDASNNLIKDTSPLAQCIFLEKLYLRDNLIKKLQCLAHLQSLTLLDISNNQLENLQCLTSLQSLTWLDASNNQLKGSYEEVLPIGIDALSTIKFQQNNGLQLEKDNELQVYEEKQKFELTTTFKELFPNLSRLEADGLTHTY